MKKSLIPFALFCVLSVFSASGQGMTNYERRNLNDKLLKLVLSYERFSSFSESHMRFSFLELFLSADASVYCDYVAANDFDRQITAEEYVAYSMDSIRVKYVELRNLKKGNYFFEKGRCHVVLEFDKCIEYEDRIGTYFSTTDPLVGGDIHYKMECVYDQAEEKFLIASIAGRPSPDIRFPSGKFFVVERKHERDDLVKVNGLRLRYNAFNETYVEGPVSPVFEDEDIVVKMLPVASAERYSKVNFFYKETRFRGKLTFTAAPISAYRVHSPISFSAVRSSAYEASVDVGYALPVGTKSKLAFFLGVGASTSSLGLAVSDVAYDYELSDPSAMTYTRSYRLTSAEEGLSFLDIMFPLYASYEFSAGSGWVISADAGVKLYLNTNTRVNPYQVEGTVSAIYEGKVRHTEVLSSPITQYMIPVSYGRNTYDVAAFGKIGLEYRISGQGYLFAKTGYLYGLTTSYHSGLNEWWNSEENIYPFVYSVKSNTDVAVRSFADCIAYRRASLTFDLGFRMKF